MKTPATDQCLEKLRIEYSFGTIDWNGTAHLALVEQAVKANEHRKRSADALLRLADVAEWFQRMPARSRHD